MPVSSLENAHKEKVELEITDNSIKKIQRYVELDNSHRQIKATISNLKKEEKVITTEKKELERPIITILTQAGFDSVNINDGELKPKISKRVVPINNSYIEEALKEYLLIHKDRVKCCLDDIDDIVNLSKEMSQFIIKDNRKYTEKSYLSRSINK